MKPYAQFSKTILTLLSFYFFLSSCKTKFDEPQARNLIIQELNLPYTKTGNLQTGDFIIDRMNTYTRVVNEAFYEEFGNSTYNRRYLELINEGYMTANGRIQHRENDFSGYGVMVFNLSFTDKAKPFIISSNGNATTVKIGEINLGSISNMRKVNDDEYEVEFSLNFSTNQFTKVAYENSIITKIQDNLQSLKIKIYRYEKGWQISTDDLKRVKQMGGIDKN